MRREAEKMLKRSKNGAWVLALALIGLALAGCAPTIAAAPAAPVAQVRAATPQEVYPRLPGDLGGGLILLDVRTPQEWAEDGHIAGATLIPLAELEARAAGELPQDAEIVVYCRSGNRSQQAAAFLVEAGYTDVSDMGGVRDWIAAGYEVEYGQ